MKLAFVMAAAVGLSVFGAASANAAPGYGWGHNHSSRDVHNHTSGHMHGKSQFPKTGVGRSNWDYNFGNNHRHEHFRSMPTHNHFRTPVRRDCY